MKKRYIFWITGSIILALTIQAQAQPRIIVNVAKPGVRISPTMWGVFFEDINFGADGGLYSELVKNRSFEFPNALTGWNKLEQKDSVGDITVHRDANQPKNPQYARLRVDKQGQGFGLSNEGFRGMGIRQNAQYRFSIQARLVKGNVKALRIELVDSKGRQLAQGRVEGFTNQWQIYSCILTSTATEPKAHLDIWIEGTGILDIDMVSLFPKDTWKGRENGLRTDLIQMLADLKPGFIRFPGGCIVEGFDLAQRYQWKNTIGEPNQRGLIKNRWNTEFKHRLTTDYFQSFGLGFYEFFLLAEDIGAEPLPIINCGMACQFNTGQLVPMDKLPPYVQDALDLIEFANGPVNSEWGSKRAQIGHPEPFNMKMIGIGNEQWGPQYIERYKVFAKAIKEKYPDIQLIAATGSDPTIFPNGHAEVTYLWSELRKLNADIVDEHFYRDPDWFLENTGLYDSFERRGPKVFVGEYAAQSKGVASPDNRNNWQCALAEAAFMTGLERNAELVVMTSYAPLFAHNDAWQWTPDLIWFDNLRVYGTPNYYVQKMFSLNRGDRLLSAEVEGLPSAESKKKTLIVSSCLDEKAGEVILKAVNVTGRMLEAAIELQGIDKIGSLGKAIILTAEKNTDENSFENPKKVHPVESSLSLSGSTFNYTFKPYSLTVLRIPMAK